jgi:GH25 family lysozyme M1 (1,4-beta-N-acetylmuramidase)
MAIKIETGVPVTVSHRGKEPSDVRKALRAMRVGESFVAPDGTNIRSLSMAMFAESHQQGRKVRFTRRQNRVWRIK